MLPPYVGGAARSRLLSILAEGGHYEVRPAARRTRKNRLLDRPSGAVLRRLRGGERMGCRRQGEVPAFPGETPPHGSDWNVRILLTGSAGRPSVSKRTGVSGIGRRGCKTGHRRRPRSCRMRCKYGLRACRAGFQPMCGTLRGRPRLARCLHLPPCEEGANRSVP